MSVASLTPCWEKLAWAKEQRDGLHEYIRQLFAVEGNRPCLGIKFHPDTAEYSLYVSAMPDLGAAFVG